MIELNGQSLVLARLHTKRILGSADYAAQSGTIAQQVSLLRQERHWRRKVRTGAAAHVRKPVIC